MKFSKKEKGLTIAAHYAKGKFPALYTRHESFPCGESLDDMARRAEDVIDEILVPQLLQERQDGSTRTVAIFSHGLFIAELIAAVIKRDLDYKGNADVRNLRGMKNTAWTRVEVKIKVRDNISLIFRAPYLPYNRSCSFRRVPLRKQVHTMGEEPSR
jgi:broad specificity phosphatase PhoE